MSDTIRLISLNVRGISNFQKRRSMFTWFRRKRADIIFIQETHSKKELESQWKNEWGAELIFSHGSPNARGVAILFKKGVDYCIQSKIIDPLGRFIILKVEIEDSLYVLINVYAPNKDKEISKFFNDLLVTIRREELDTEENFIVGGDFNCPLNPVLDKKGGSLTPRKSVVTSIDCFREELDLVDIWRVQNPITKSFTWSQKSPKIFCRLDYWLISNNLQDFIASTCILPAIKTDHAAIVVDLKNEDNQMKGPGIWKMNCSLLEDVSYVNDVTEKIPVWIAEGEKDLTDNRSIWEWLKYNIRANAIEHSIRRAHERKQREESLQADYSRASKVYEEDTNNITADQLNSAKEKLELFYEEKVKGIIIRARARWHEHGERSTKYFLNLEKRNHIKKHMRKLDINGSVTTDPSTILSEQKRFYQDLYASGHQGSDAVMGFLDTLDIPKLSEEQKNACEGKICPMECKLILETFQDNKAPGNDGIPAEFYKKFWNLISEPFVKCANECFEKMEMSNSQKQAVITLIEKKGKDRMFLENWRPISLVNVDAKLMSKVLANRIKSVLPNIIHHNQTGYVQDRYIGETIRSIFDIMEFTVKRNVPGMLIFIDFQKAFDSLEWDFIFGCLDAFNFGPDFSRWVKTFYKNIASCVINNGNTSDYFFLERGVRQGDPLSPYLFVLAAEALAIAVRQNTEIKGIFIGEQETKLLQYADDMTAVLSDTDSALALFSLLDSFKKASGLTINCAKTEGMWIGSTRANKAKPFGINWPKEPIKALGIFYTYDQKLLQEKNFLENLDKIKKLLNIWHSRGLSLYGKVTVIKSLVVPKFVYVSSLMPTPKEIISELNRLLYKFLWNGTDKVTRLSTINDYDKGGLQMIDLDCTIKSLRLAWLKRIFSAHDGTWKTYLRYILERYGGLFLFNCNFEIKDYSLDSQFYAELLQWWSEFRENFGKTKDWRNIIWNNKDIRINNTPVFYKNYFDSGIVFVNDLLFSLNNIDSFKVINNKVNKTNFLVWAGLRHSVPTSLKGNSAHSEISFSIIIDNNDFDVTKKKSKHFYSLLISIKAQLPSAARKLQNEFNLTTSQVEQVFNLPHKVALETYVKAFQYKVLNSILYTNTKLQKIGYSTDDKCTFCKSEPETLYHLLYNCPHSQTFWANFELFWYSSIKEKIHLTLQDVLVGILTRSCPLLNYFLLIAKIYIWDCRRNQVYPNITGFKLKVQIKYETELYIWRQGRKKDFLKEKWAGFQNLL